MANNRPRPRERENTSVAIGASETTVAECDVTGYETIGVLLKNTGGNALTDVKVYAGMTVDTATTDINSAAISTTLASGATGIKTIANNPYGYIKVTATRTNATTVTCQMILK